MFSLHNCTLSLARSIDALPSTLLSLGTELPRTVRASPAQVRGGSPVCSTGRPSTRSLAGKKQPAPPVSDLTTAMLAAKETAIEEPLRACGCSNSLRGSCPDDVGRG